MTKVHKSCDVSQNEFRPVVLSMGEPARRFVRGGLHAGLPAAAAASVPDADDRPASVLSGSVLLQARQAADQLLARAGSEAERLIREARAQAVDIERDAYEAGYQTGYQAGCRQARLEQAEQSRRMTEQIESAVGDLERRNRQQMERLEPEVLELSLQVAEKVIGRELSRNDEAFRSLVRAALARIRQSDRVCVRVNDRDADWLAEGVAAGLPIADSVQVKGESQLPAGTCLIETDAGLVDASVPVQLRRIRERLQEAGA